MGWPYIFGLVIMVDVLIIGWAPYGPWNDDSFSLGVLGIIGVAALYLSWYRWRFKRRGCSMVEALEGLFGAVVKVSIVGLMVAQGTWSLYASGPFPLQVV